MKRREHFLKTNQIVIQQILFLEQLEPFVLEITTTLENIQTRHRGTAKHIVR